MSRIDKTEDKVNKVFREYQDNWCKYAESLEKGSTNVKVREEGRDRRRGGRERGRVCVREREGQRVCVRGREYQDNWCKYIRRISGEGLD